jgi:hypothetical protein
VSSQMMAQMRVIIAAAALAPLHIVDCAQFCAYHQTLPSATECLHPIYLSLETLAGQGFCGTESSSVTLCRKLLILRATNPWAQGVVGSNPIAPTKFQNQALPRVFSRAEV